MSSKNSNQANLETLKNRARKEDPVAQYKLAKLYKTGKFVEKDLKQYINLLESAAKNGEGDAINELADCYANGVGVEVNETAAINWYKEAVSQGNVSANYNMAVIILNEIDEDFSSTLSDDLIKAEKMLRFAANKGKSEAQYQLGMLYQLGIQGLKKDFIESERWLKKAAENNDLNAQNELGYLYANGSEDGKIKKDFHVAMEWWKKAAEKNHSEAQYNLAVSYAQEAILFWNKSSKLGNEKSKYMIEVAKKCEWDR